MACFGSVMANDWSADTQKQSEYDDKHKCYIQVITSVSILLDNEMVILVLAPVEIILYGLSYDLTAVYCYFIKILNI